MTYTVVFQAGDGYARYRIPAIVAGIGGVLHAYAEGRCGFGGDWGRVDVVERTSDDGGVTWGALRVVSVGPPGAESPVAIERGFPAGPTWHNPTPISTADGVHLLYCENYQRALHLPPQAEAATDITHVLRDGYAYRWRVCAVGPGHAAECGGKLVVPAWLSLGTDGREAHAPSISVELYSDDAGQTWSAGPIVAEGACNPNEWTAAPGVGLIRTERERLVVRGAAQWGAPEPSGIEGPPCMGSLLRLDDGRYAFSGIVSDKPRGDLWLWLTANGDGWSKARPIHEGPARYSDLVLVPGGGLGCLYEFGSQSKGGVAFRHLGIV